MPPESRPRSFNEHGEMVNHRLSFYHIWRLRSPPPPTRGWDRREKFGGAVIGADWLLCAVTDRSLSPAARAAAVVDTLQKCAQPSRIAETFLWRGPVHPCPRSGGRTPRGTLTELDRRFGPLPPGLSPLQTRLRPLGEMAEKRRSPCALSVKAHAFSVEALIGTEKRRKTSGEDAADQGTHVPELTESAASRLDGGCASDRGSECASVGSRR